jgi:urea transport system substrate-binding protein
MSVKNPINDEWKKQWAAYSKEKNLPGASKPLTDDPMEASRTGILMWKAAVEKAGTTDVDAVRKAMIGQKLNTPSGYEEVMGANHHLSKPVMIGEIKADGQFNVIYKTPKAIPAKPWSQYIDGNAGKPDSVQ